MKMWVSHVLGTSWQLCPEDPCRGLQLSGTMASIWRNSGFQILLSGYPVTLAVIRISAFRIFRIPDHLPAQMATRNPETFRVYQASE